MRNLILLFTLIFLHNTNTIAQCTSDSNLPTAYNSNNGQRGAMFDITATSCVTVRCFDANLYAGTTANYEIYYKVGSFIGSENNAGAWTFLGGATGITSAGNNIPTYLPIPVNVSIPTGETYAFYITNDFGGGTSYRDCNSASDALATDTNISITGGVGKSYPFGLTFSYRCFNGTVHYDADCTPPDPCASATSGFVR